jgi:hypothetical protein
LSGEVECHVAFSLGGSFAAEVWQAIPGTPLDIPEPGVVHHTRSRAWCTTPLPGRRPRRRGERLDALGYPSYATAGTTPSAQPGPAGTLIELCDLRSERPPLRDVFPPGSEFAGKPLLGSAR